MSMLVFACVAITLILSLVLLYFCILNNFDKRLLDQIIPVTGAMVLLTIWIANQVYIQRPEKLFYYDSIGHIEYASGGIVTAVTGKSTRPLSLKKMQTWIKYVEGWNNLFYWKNLENNKATCPSVDRCYLQYMELFIFNHIAGTFASGWNPDTSRLATAPTGEHGGKGMGVPFALIKKTTYRQALEKSGLHNKFLPAKPERDEPELAVPVNTEVTIERKEGDNSSFSYVFRNPRFSYVFSVELSKSKFSGMGFKDHYNEKLFAALTERHIPPGMIRTPESFSIRLFNISNSFEQTPKYRFSDQADLDKVFSENIWKEIVESLGWKGIQKDYENAVFANL
ncbi:hypothetical protein [Bdellovibrio bacteriovorus]|uniref:hypothetical protein n=1 Tax=Bdellovibrio bacteriovorus TaxID=959 RepID=UPI0035A957C5